MFFWKFGTDWLHCDFGEIAGDWLTWVVSRDASASKNANNFLMHEVKSWWLMVGYKTSNSNIGDIPWNQFAGLALCEWCSGHGRVGTWASVRCCLGQHVPQPGQLVWQLLHRASVEYCLQPASTTWSTQGKWPRQMWPLVGPRLSGTSQNPLSGTSQLPQAICFIAVGEPD